jgi:hypothetical protein
MWHIRRRDPLLRTNQRAISLRLLLYATANILSSKVQPTDLEQLLKREASYRECKFGFFSVGVMVGIS